MMLDNLGTNHFFIVQMDKVTKVLTSKERWNVWGQNTKLKRQVSQRTAISHLVSVPGVADIVDGSAQPHRQPLAAPRRKIA